MAEKTLQELVIARGTKQKFDELPEKSPDALYFLTDGNTFVETNQGAENAGKVMTVGPDGMLAPAEGGGSGLPDQTGNAGKFLKTDGTNASWAEALENKSSKDESVQILSNLQSVGDYAVVVGARAKTTDHYGTAIGYQSSAAYMGTAIGFGANALGNNIQIGTGTNRQYHTLCVGYEWGTNYKLLDSNGIIPSARLAADPAEDGNYVLKAIKSGDTITTEWGTGGSGGGAVDSVNGMTGDVWLSGLNIAAQVGDEYKAVQYHLQDLSDEIDDLRLFKFPNAIIVGEPNIDHGQVSGFSADNYLQFPFIVDLHNRPFQIDFSFTTGNDVTTQQNILDSNFGLALAIANGHGLMAISHNGTSCAGSVTGSLDIQPNTTYYARLSWNRMNYQTQLSTDGSSFTPDMNFGSTQSPFPRTMFIGGCKSEVTGHTPHPFGGTINLNKALLTVEGNVIWQGMDDAGLATRADVSLDNLDEAGQAKFDAKANSADLSAHTENGTIHVTASDKIAWSQKQNKLVAGENITIDESTNTISATGGGSGLPDQTGNAGKFLTTDGTDASWTGYCGTSTNAVTGYMIGPAVVFDPMNKVAYDGHKACIAIGCTANIKNFSVGIGSATTYEYSVAIGLSSSVWSDKGVAVGYNCMADGNGAVAIGCDTNAKSPHAVAIGGEAKIERGVSYAIQLGKGTNAEANTFRVGLSDTNNYKLLGSDGIIPDERISSNFAKKSMFQVVDSTPTTFEPGVFYFVKKGA